LVDAHGPVWVDDNEDGAASVVAHGRTLRPWRRWCSEGGSGVYCPGDGEEGNQCSCRRTNHSLFHIHTTKHASFDIKGYECWANAYESQIHTLKSRYCSVFCGELGKFAEWRQMIFYDQKHSRNDCKTRANRGLLFPGRLTRFFSRDGALDWHKRPRLLRAASAHKKSYRLSGSLDSGLCSCY
jgi:hypothetical protein